MIEKINRLRWWIYVVYLSSKRIFRTQLGTIVIYKGEEYFISNGASPNSWTLQQPNYGKRVESAPRNECKKKLTFKNRKSTFHFMGIIRWRLQN